MTSTNLDQLAYTDFSRQLSLSTLCARCLLELNMSSINIQDFLNRAWRRSSSSQSRPSQAAAGASAGTTAGPSSATPTTVAYASSLQHHGILHLMDRFPLIPSHDSVGQDVAIEKVCGFLKSAQVKIVGIYGMGGVGKTTLMKMVHNKFLVGCDFDLILWVVVSKDWNYDKVRRLIIRRLGVGPFDPAADVDAMDLFNFLRGKRFVLLLDDVWEHLDLMELGVPRPTTENMSKIIFTTRSEEVCRQMLPDREIKIDCLGPSDSWALFEKNVGDKALNSHPRVRSLAQQIVKECCGLPLALIIVGRAMSSKYAPEEWKHALEVLENHPYQMPGVVSKLFSCLELSYLSLGDGTLQKCFLYSSLFPDDFSIQKDKLVDYWIGEGFLGECENLEQLRNRGSHIIGVLLAACLIENGTHEEDKEVKMHDVIRDMALWIVSDHGAKQNRFFVHPGHRLTSSEIHVRWIMAERIFVQDFNELPKLPSCPVLTTLIFDKDAQLAFKRSWYKNLENERAKDLGIGEMQIKGKEPLSDPEPIPVPSSSNAIEMPLVDDPMSSLFQLMPSLRLLELSFCRMSDLPKAVMELPKLRYLGSAGVKYLSPKVGKLSSLEILDMSCLIKPTADMNSPLLVDLPDTIAHLSGLRLLNLKDMWLKSLPQEIEHLSKLEILDLSNTPIFFLPTGIRGLRELRQLKLSGTMLHSLPEEVVYLSKLEILDLSKTKIIRLPWRIYWLGELRQLNLENTWIVQLPGEMCFLSKLEILSLSKSRIRELPNMIRRLSELRRLDLEGTLLNTLPKEIGFLLKLETLNLSGSARINGHFSGIEELCELRQLNLKGTQFLGWPVNMSKLTKLELLDLSFTFIKFLPSTISLLVELRQLNLEQTCICTLEEEVSNLSKLEILNLNRTLIRELPTWINRLHQLRKLYLDNTLLKILPNEVGDLTKLEILSLSGTCIEEIPSWIDQLPELKELNLTGTPCHQVNFRRSVALPSRAATPDYRR